MKKTCQYCGSLIEEGNSICPLCGESSVVDLGRD